MTPKERLKLLRDSFVQWSQFGLEHFDVVSKALNELEDLKKPPTVDEVCKALSEHYKEQVSYSNERHNHMFYFEKSRLGIVTLRDGNIVFIQGDFHKTNNLSPRLVTLIGRFYEGVVKQND